MSHSQTSTPPPLPPSTPSATRAAPVIDYQRPDELALLARDPAARAARARRLIASAACVTLAMICAALAVVLLRAIDRNPESLCSFAWPVLVMVCVGAFLLQRGVKLFNSRNL